MFMDHKFLSNIENYKIDEDPGPFSKNNEFIYYAEKDGIVYKGFKVLEKNSNKAGIAHGGTHIAFADGIMGYTAWKTHKLPCLTAKLSGNYLAPAPLGSWVYGFAEITRATKSIIFMKCNLYINDSLIFNADGIFKILKNHGTKDPS